MEPESAVKVSSILGSAYESLTHLQVEFSVVNTEAHLAILLPDYNDWRREWRLTLTERPSVKKLLKMFVNSFYVMWVYWPGSVSEWCFISQFDVVLKFVLPKSI